MKSHKIWYLQTLFFVKKKLPEKSAGTIIPPPILNFYAFTWRIFSRFNLMNSSIVKRWLCNKWVGKYCDCVNRWAFIVSFSFWKLPCILELVLELLKYFYQLKHIRIRKNLVPKRRTWILISSFTWSSICPLMSTVKRAGLLILTITSSFSMRAFPTASGLTTAFVIGSPNSFLILTSTSTPVRCLRILFYPICTIFNFDNNMTYGFLFLLTIHPWLN